MKVPITGAPLSATEAIVVHGAAGETYRQAGELPPDGDVVAVADGQADLDVPFGCEAIVFYSDGGFLSASHVRVGQTFGDPYRAIKLDVTKAELTVDIELTEMLGPDPGDQVQAAAEVEWGDGGYEVVAPPIDTLSHTYAQPGSYDIHIRFGFETDPRPSYAHHHVTLD